MTRRIPHLDILRAAAILLVMGRHMTPATEAHAGSVVAAVTTVLERGGWIGVDLFFVLSGFLVSGLLFKEYQRTGTVDIGRFLIRRGFKIYPPFYVLLLILVVVGWDVLTWRRILVDVFFVQNYFSPSVTWATWSLAIEEHFYLMLACLTWCLVRWRSQPFRWIPAIWITVAAGCLAARISLMDRPFDTSTHLLPTHLRIDALLFGVLLAYGWHCSNLRERARPWSRWLCLLGIALLVPPFVQPIQTPWISAWGLTMNYLGAGAVLIGLLGLSLPSRAPLQWLAFLGVHSYSIFLWHMWVNIAAKALIPSGWFVYLAVYLVGSLAIGVLATRLIEHPALAVRDRYFPARSRALQANPSGSPLSPTAVTLTVSH